MLGIIPARRGSKGLPGKNVRSLLGKPMIAWTIEAARRSRSLSRVICTSDDPDVISVCRELGCEVPFVRPADLANDHASMPDVVRHALREINSQDECFVLLQPTSPLRRSEDIEGAIALFRESSMDGCVTVTETKAHPEWMFDIGPQSRLLGMVADSGNQRPTRRQDVRPFYVPNGAVYVHRVDRILREDFAFLGGNISGYVMPKERSVDVDDLYDFATAEAFAKQTSRD